MGIEHRSPVRLIGACRTGLLLLCAVLVALFLSASLRVTQGQPVAPLDDSYIHFQYARSLAEGHLGSYTEHG